MKNNMIYLLLGIMLLCACKKTDLETDQVKNGLDEINPNSDDKYKIVKNGVHIYYLLDLINNVRSKGCTCNDDGNPNGIAMPSVTKLTVNDLISKAALNHTENMWNFQMLAHSFYGDSLKDRLLLVSYNPQLQGENVAAGYENELDVFNGWLSSGGHCKNIMSAKFTEMGAARIENVWTLDFAKPKP